MGLIAGLLLFLNHGLEKNLGHDAIVVDICIGVGYLMYIIL